MSQVDSMRREIVQWAPHMASMLNYLVLMYPDHPQYRQRKQSHAAAVQLSDPEYVKSLSTAELTAKHEFLKAFMADKKKRDEDSKRLSAEVKSAFEELK